MIEKIRSRSKGDIYLDGKSERYVVHILSLQTLHTRGFRTEPNGIFNEQGKLVRPQTTSGLRKRIHEVHNFRQYPTLRPCFECAVHICVDGTWKRSPARSKAIYGRRMLESLDA